MSAMWLIVCGFLAILISVSCGGDKTPTAPTPPPIVQMGGLWNYSVRPTSITGGECVGAAAQALIGLTASGTMSITQTGTALTATATDGSTGITCAYTGTASSSSAVFNGTRCDDDAIRLRCPSGVQRDVSRVANSLDAQVSGTIASGTSVETFNVYIAGTGTNVGVMTTRSAFNATKR